MHAKVVINATGPFADTIRRMSDPACTPMIQPSAGAHITLPDFYAGKGVGMIIPRTKDGRVLFMLPWQDRVIAGTTGMELQGGGCCCSFVVRKWLHAYTTGTSGV